MEFSVNKPSKQHSVRSNPYSSGGKSYLRNVKKSLSKRMMTYSTPPRKYSQLNHQTYSQRSSSFKPRSLSRASHILQNSQASNNLKESSTQSKWIAKIDSSSSPSRPVKRQFKSLDLALDTSSDPFNIFSGSDDDEDDNIFLSAKHDKHRASVTNKENKLKSSVSKNTPKVYTNNVNKKIKTVDILSSNILHDISPEKVNVSFESEKKKYVKIEPKNGFRFKRIIGKENSHENFQEEEENLVPIGTEHSYMIGFPNFGNTCYLNAVLQTLVSLQPFIGDLNSAMDVLSVSSSSVVHSLWNIIIARYKLDLPLIRNSLRAMKENIEKVDGSFTGFKMQDANEFLTQVLDTVKNEIEKLSNPQKENSQEVCVITHDKLPSLVEPSSFEDKNCANASFKENSKPLGSKSIFSTPTSSSPLSLEMKVSENGDHSLEEDNIFLTPKQRQILCSQTKPFSNHDCDYINKQSYLPCDVTNPVKNNFEFELFESYRCLGCDETEGRRQKHFALYINLPTESHESIQKAVEAYMSEDQRELTCQSCKHNKASFLTSFVQLPRILIVQMKRYEYKPEQLECIKVSSKVEVSMWLHLDKLISQEFSPPPNFRKKSLSLTSSKETNAKTLSVRNLSSELNICSQAKEESATSPSTKVICSNSQDSNSPKEKEKESNDHEDKELQEVLIRSMNDIGGEGVSKPEVDPDEEEEEFQKAIKLSLQDLGMCYSHQSAAEELDDSKNGSEAPAEREEEGGSGSVAGKHSYHLVSVISHFGLTTCTGHYVSDVFNMEKKRWYHYDDEAVSSLPESVLLSEGRQKNGYIFFYVHQDIFQDLMTDK